MADPRNWKDFERLVAAIHKLVDQGGDVRWNEKISGRQFDVTIRFKKGLYPYLTVIECRAYKKPVSVDKVEAFVIKSRDAHAHHAVMASTAGFQSGALDAARRHNITLIKVSESDEINLSAIGAHWGPPTDALHIETIELEYADSEVRVLPAQSNALSYYANEILIEQNGSRESLAKFIERHSRQLEGAQDDYADHVIPITPGAMIVAPDDGEIPLKAVAKIRVRAAVTQAKTLHGPAMLDPYLLIPDIMVRNLATGESQLFNPHDLALGVDTVFEEGKFYESPQLSMYYYCERIEGDTVRLYLIESYQHGRLIQADFRIKIEYANRYVEVSEKIVLERLRRRLEKLKATSQPAKP